MKASLRALLHGVIDYAGLFPPARLPLAEAIHNYARCRSQTEAWMLGRFICPADRLKELDCFAGPLFSKIMPLSLSVLGSGGNSASEYLDHLDRDLASLQSFVGRHAQHVRPDVLELRLPADAAANATLLAEVLVQSTTRFGNFGFATLKPFFELVAGACWNAQFDAAVQALAQFNRTRSGREPRAGFKLRCGGLESSAFPGAEQVALCLYQCVATGTPFKATAGLHHPIRRYDASVQTEMHGFVNVFGAGVVAAKYGCHPDVLQRILAEKDPATFQFTDESFCWRDYSVPTKEIASLRAELLTSFGSCSFDEPRDDLQQLGWLPSVRA